MTPRFRVLYLDLKRAARETLTGPDLAFGSVLHAFALEKSRLPVFEKALRRASSAIARVPRWRRDGLRAFLEGLIHNRRPLPEHRRLREALQSTLDPRQKREVRTMQETIAEYLIRKGRNEGLKEGRQEGRQEGHQEGRQEGRQEGHQEGLLESRRETLLSLLREKFGRVPRAFGQAIRETSDSRRLDRWLKRIVHAATLEDMRISRGNGRG